MKDVAAILARHCTDPRALLDELAASPSAQSNTFFAEIVRRIRRAAGYPALDTDEGPKELLELLDRLDDNQ